MHIDPADLAIVQDILCVHVPWYEVWAFGSRVHGRNLKPFSDLDLMIMADRLLDPRQFSDLREAFSESPIHFRIHLFNWSTVGRMLRQAIEADHVVIQRLKTG